MKGVPVRIALGARDLENNVAEVARRDTKEKKAFPWMVLHNIYHRFCSEISSRPCSIRQRLIATNILQGQIAGMNLKKLLDEKGGFISAHWDGTAETEEAIKEKTKATIRCIPLNGELENGKCILTGKPSKQRVLFARAY